MPTRSLGLSPVYFIYGSTTTLSASTRKLTSIDGHHRGADGERWTPLLTAENHTIRLLWIKYFKYTRAHL